MGELFGDLEDKCLENLHCLVMSLGSANTRAYEWGMRRARFQMTEKNEEYANLLLFLMASIISLHRMRFDAKSSACHCIVPLLVC